MNIQMCASSAHTFMSSCKPCPNIKASTARVEVVSSTSYVSKTLGKYFSCYFEKQRKKINSLMANIRHN